MRRAVFALFLVVSVAMPFAWASPDSGALEQGRCEIKEDMVEILTIANGMRLEGTGIGIKGDVLVSLYIQEETSGWVMVSHDTRIACIMSLGYGWLFKGPSA